MRATRRGQAHPTGDQPWCGNGRQKEVPLTTIRVELTFRTMLYAISGVGFVYLLLELWPVLLVIVAALMLVGALAPFIATLERRGLRRGYAIAIVFGSLFLTVVLFAALTLPRFATQLAEIVARLPRAQADVAARLERTKFGGPLAQSLREAKTGEPVANALRAGVAASAKIVEILAYAATSVFLSLYLLIDRDRMRGAVFSLIPRTYHVRVSRILLNLETIVGGYLRGQVITSVMMSVFTFGVLSIARVPNALALSLFAGLADVLPYVGALLACGPAVLAALSRGMTVALVVLAVLSAYQEFESRFIVPRIYGNVLRLPPAIVMIALLIGGKLLGIIGALLALPIAAGIRMIMTELRFELPGEDVDDSELRARDERGERDFERRAAGTPASEAAAIASEIATEMRDNDASDAAGAAQTAVTGGTKHAD